MDRNAVDTIVPAGCGYSPTSLKVGVDRNNAALKAATESAPSPTSLKVGVDRNYDRQFHCSGMSARRPR